MQCLHNLLDVVHHLSGSNGVFACCWCVSASATAFNLTVRGLAWHNACSGMYFTDPALRALDRWSCKRCYPTSTYDRADSFGEQCELAETGAGEASQELRQLPLFHLAGCPLIPLCRLATPIRRPAEASHFERSLWVGKAGAVRLQASVVSHALTSCGAAQGRQGNAVGPGVGLKYNAEAPKDGGLHYPCCLLLCKQRLWSGRPRYLDQKDRWAGESDLNNLGKCTAVGCLARKGLPIQFDESYIARCGACMDAKNAFSNTGASTLDWRKCTSRRWIWKLEP